MREIKFRGYNGEKWLFGNLDIDYKTKQAAISDDRWWRHPVRFDTVGQYTGLRDSDGREIYEGDVLNSLYGHLGVSYKQEWAAFVACGVDSTGYYHEYLLDEIVNTLVRRAEIKVIGNIHDDPKLMEVAHD